MSETPAARQTQNPSPASRRGSVQEAYESFGRRGRRSAIANPMRMPLPNLRGKKGMPSDMVREMIELRQNAAATKLQAAARRWLVRKVMPTLKPLLETEKLRRAKQRREERWKADRRASEQAGYAFGSPRGERISSALDDAAAAAEGGDEATQEKRRLRKWLSNGATTGGYGSRVPHAQLLPAHVAQKWAEALILPALAEEPLRGRRARLGRHAGARAVGDVAQSARAATTRVPSRLDSGGGGESTTELSFARSASAPARRPPGRRNPQQTRGLPAPSAEDPSPGARRALFASKAGDASCARSEALVSAERATGGGSSSSSSPSPAALRASRASGAKSGAKGGASRGAGAAAGPLSLKLVGAAGGDHHRQASHREEATAATAKGAYRCPAPENAGFYQSGNETRERAPRLKATGRHTNTSQIGPAAVPLAEMACAALGAGYTPGYTCIGALPAPASTRGGAEYDDTVDAAAESEADQDAAAENGADEGDGDPAFRGDPAFQPPMRRRPPIVSIPRSEANALGLAPEPSDREVVALVMAAHNQREQRRAKAAAMQVARSSSAPVARPPPRPAPTARPLATAAASTHASPIHSPPTFVLASALDGVPDDPPDYLW